MYITALGTPEEGIHDLQEEVESLVVAETLALENSSVTVPPGVRVWGTAYAVLQGIQAAVRIQLRTNH